jgi:adenylate cyclase
MIVGNMGAENKMDYTIMGNHVNLAARLEGVNKQYGTWILASENTINETGGSILSRRLDRVRVVGIEKPVRLCEVLELAGDAPPFLVKQVQLFHDALAIYEKRDWKAAQAAFEAVLGLVPDDRPAKLYHNRCGEYLVKPPADDWDGMYNLTEK